MKVRNIQISIITFVIFLTTFIFSLLVAPYHINGDQEHYTVAYFAVKILSIIEAWERYNSIIYTGEPIHFLLIWAFSSLGIDKNLIMAISNSILAILFAKFLLRKNFQLLFVILIILTNYYIFTMFFTLERTKFAFIFFLIAILYKKRSMLLLSIFTHSIILFPIFAYLSSKYINIRKIINLNTIVISKSLLSIFKIIGFVLLCLFVFYYLGNHLIGKFNSYAFFNFEIYQILIIFILTLLTTTNKQQVFIFFTFIIISIIILGGDRLNMLGYFSFLYFGNNKSLLFKQILSFLIIYFFIKSILYINMIITIGG